MSRKKFETIGLMIDLSRNAVMSMDAWRKFIPIISKMGYNAIFLYTEDTYEVEGEPFFGYMRGRYSIEEMKELDALGAEWGVEMIPCIQTLGHLTQIFRWKAFENDTPSTLLVGSERTYQLIDRMFKTLSECFRTRRIHIGMDEAPDVGRGKYLDQHGYKPQNEVMREHLTKVKEIGDKYGYEMLMWSDMFFRPWNNHSYYTTKCKIPKEYREAVVDGILPVYWDYYMPTEERYDDMLSNHKQFGRELWFAGGIWTWLGFTPSNSWTVKSMVPAISACRKYKVKNVFFTLWGDNGAECSRYSVLASMFYVAEVCRGNNDVSKIKAKFKSRFGIDYDEFCLLDEPNRVAINPNSIFENNSTSKYMLYSDYLAGHYDFTVKRGGNEFYRELAPKLAAVAKKSRRYGYLFDTQAKLSAILADKYELGVKTREAYKAGDKAELLRLANEEYSRIEKNLPIFHRAFEKQWMLENKTYGFEIQEQRLGGLLARTKSCKRRLIDYAEGRIASIPELEEEILPFGNYTPGYGTYLNRYNKIISANIVDHDE